MKKYFSVLIAMMVLAVFAVGCVSAEENVTTDIDVPAEDIEIDDVSVDKVVENTRAIHDVTDSDSVAYINQAISDASNDPTNHVVNFAIGTYYNASYNVQDDVVLDGHGSTLIGDGTHDIFLVTNKKNFTIKNFIINVNNNTKGHGIYGHHVYNSTITNNTIFNCSDAINIYQIHSNLTITDNTIYDFTGDGISLVNFNTSASVLNDLIGSEVSGNRITGGEFGMFFGGNFKGDISNNIITGSTYGIEFKGKKNETNGRLYATFNNNNITNVQYGINMYCPNVVFLNITNCNISLAPAYASLLNHWAIGTNSNFGSTGYIGVYNSYFAGRIYSAFKTAVGTNAANNIGF